MSPGRSSRDPLYGQFDEEPENTSGSCRTKLQSQAGSMWTDEEAQILQNCIRISNNNVLIRNAIGSKPKAFHGYDPSPRIP
jgi:hypothetical protein